MVFMWLSAFAPFIAKLQTSQCSFGCFSRFSICRNPAGNATDGSLTVYADDVAKVFLLQDAGQYRSATASTAIAYLTASEKSLHDCLEPAGIAPNNDKTEAIPALFGEGSFHARIVFSSSGTAKTGGRHLGSLHSYCNSNAPEISARINSMRNAFRHMGKFCKACRNRKMVQTMFHVSFKHHWQLLQRS